MNALFGLLVFIVLPLVFLVFVWALSKSNARNNPIRMNSFTDLWISAKSGNAKSIFVIVFVLTMIVFITIVRTFFGR